MCPSQDERVALRDPPGLLRAGDVQDDKPTATLERPRHRHATTGGQLDQSAAVCLNDVRGRMLDRPVEDQGAIKAPRSNRPQAAQAKPPA